MAHQWPGALNCSLATGARVAPAPAPPRPRRPECGAGLRGGLSAGGEGACSRPPACGAYARRGGRPGPARQMVSACGRCAARSTRSTRTARIQNTPHIWCRKRNSAPLSRNKTNGTPTTQNELQPKATQNDVNKKVEKSKREGVLQVQARDLQVRPTGSR